MFNALLLDVKESLNKEVKQYTCLLTELHNSNKGQRVNNKNIANRKRKERKNLKRTERANGTFRGKYKAYQKPLK